MTSVTGLGWSCAKCGRGGLTSVTYIGGLATCAYCVAEMQPKAPAAVPLDGPGSHAWDLAEQRAQRARADALEAKLAEAETKISTLTTLNGNQGKRIFDLRRELTAIREERASQPAAEAPNATVPLADEAGIETKASEPRAAGERPADERPDPTHHCKVCGALWIKLPATPLGGWSLWSKRAGPCCDNAEMGEQIEPLTSFKRNCDPGPWGEPVPAPLPTRCDDCGHHGRCEKEKVRATVPGWRNKAGDCEARIARPAPASREEGPLGDAREVKP